MTLLTSRLEGVNAMAQVGVLSEVDISDRGVKITLLYNSVPPFSNLVCGMLPHRDCTPP